MTKPSRDTQKKFRSFQVLPSLALLLSVMLSEAAFGGFTYFYTDPGLPGANLYIDSATNVEISGSGGIRFYQVSRGGPAHKSGEIVYKFDFASEVQNASLLANAPVWRWSYGYGSSFIHGSKDGQNWVELASAPVPAANGQANSGAINGPLPASLLGGNSLYIRTTLNNYSNNPQFFRDTAQHSRAAFGGANPVFKLDVNHDLAPLPGGGGTSFDPGPGVVFGDPGTASNDLSQQHRLSAQSLAGSEAIHRTNTITRSFTVSRDDELLDPTPVYVGALLDGQLLVDNGGVASVEASFRILDAAGVQVGDALANYSEDLTIGIGSFDQSNVEEVLLIDALLTPGETYKLESTLSIWADAKSELGGARAFFDNTFEVTLSGVPISSIPEPSTLALLGAGALGLLWRRASARA